jgi:hypothetical protein
VHIRKDGGGHARHDRLGPGVSRHCARGVRCAQLTSARSVRYAMLEDSSCDIACELHRGHTRQSRAETAKSETAAPSDFVPCGTTASAGQAYTSAPLCLRLRRGWRTANSLDCEVVHVVAQRQPYDESRPRAMAGRLTVAGVLPVAPGVGGRMQLLLRRSYTASGHSHRWRAVGAVQRRSDH